MDWKVQMFLIKEQSTWSRGMILASGASGPGFDSPCGPVNYFLYRNISTIYTCYFWDGPTLVRWTHQFVLYVVKVSLYIHRRNIPNKKTFLITRSGSLLFTMRNEQLVVDNYVVTTPRRRLCYYGPDRWYVPAKCQKKAHFFTHLKKK